MTALARAGRTVKTKQAGRRITVGEDKAALL